MTTSYYDILEVDSTATNAQIKKAYRKLVLKFHPDKNNGNMQYEHIIKRLNESYTTLSDPESRKLYDQQLLINQTGLQPEPEFGTAAEDEYSLRDLFYDNPYFVLALLGLLARMLMQ